jgi:hypothetical protein
MPVAGEGGAIINFPSGDTNKLRLFTIPFNGRDEADYI